MTVFLLANYYLHVLIHLSFAHISNLFATVQEVKKSSQGFSNSGGKNALKTPLCFVPEALYMDAESALPTSTPDAGNYVSRSFENLSVHSSQLCSHSI